MKRETSAEGYRGRNPLRRLRTAWRTDLDPGERNAVLSWVSFTSTFAATRGLTHWIRDGHGPNGGGMSADGVHLHHYNIGIVTLSALSAAALRRGEKVTQHPIHAIAYGFANALIADEAALLLNLQDVYWAKEGRESVDLALGAIGFGGAAITAIPWIRHSRHRRHAN